jgi:hypothetical protein
MAESILSIDLKNNEELLEDFEGVEAGDVIKITGEFRVSQLSESRLSAPLVSLISVTAQTDDEDEDEDESEEEAEE